MPSYLRPLSTVELVDAGWLLLRRTWARLYACSTGGTVPLAGLTLWYFQWLGTLVAGTENSEFYGGTLLWAAGMALAWALNSVARGAATAIALSEARGEPLSMADGWRRAGRQAGSAVFVGLACFAGAWLSSMCLVFPGLILAAGWWVAGPVVLAEGRPYGAALRRSWKLTDGYRVRSCGLWMLFIGLWAVMLLNLHLLLTFLVGSGAEIIGVDTSGFSGQLRPDNQSYLVFLFLVAFVLLDPLRCAVDAAYYLDLRVRREGADLQERLRALRTAAVTAFALLLLAASPARATPLEQYAARIRALRQQVSASQKPDQVDRTLVGNLRNQMVEVPGGQKLDVRNDWISDEMAGWKTQEDKQRLLNRLDALDRSLSGAGSGAQPSGAASVDAAGDPKQRVQQLLQEPEFQPLADRPELRDLAKSLDLRKTQPWWKAFGEWLQKNVFQWKPPPVNAPNVQGPNLDFLTPVVYVLLALALLYVLALIVRAIIERPVRDAARTASAAAEAPPLEASQTENALDHSVDEWELFAQQWLGRGELRQAIRALYLATLVHLHRERKIDYNRALTNWVYVRQFRGEAEAKEILRGLTGLFDEVWYGERTCEEPQYRAFEQGVRALGTPAPTGGPAHA